MIAAFVLFTAATPFEDASGLTLTQGEQAMAITNVAKDSAADSAGLEATDTLIHIDGKAVAGLNVAELSEFVQKKGGTTHRVVVKRDGKSKMLTLKLDKPV